MKVELEIYTPEQWYAYAESAHLLVFKKERAAWLDRISFALLARRRDEVIGWVTCREFDGETLYWQFGGALDEQRGLAAVHGFRAFLDYTRDRYKRCTTFVSNENIGYLHLLMKTGFRIIGSRFFRKEIYLELIMEFDDAVSKQSAEALPLHEASESREEVRSGNLQ